MTMRTTGAPARCARMPRHPRSRPGWGFVTCCRIVVRNGLRRRVDPRSYSGLLPTADRLDSGPVGQPDKLGDAPHPELGHHAAPVDLDGLFHRAEAGGDLLVEPPGDHVLKDLALTVGEGGEPFFDRFAFLPLLARGGIDLGRMYNGRKECVALDR